MIVKKDILVIYYERLMVLLFENGFSGWGQFLQSFCRSTREYDKFTCALAKASQKLSPSRKTTVQIDRGTLFFLKYQRQLKPERYKTYVNSRFFDLILRAPHRRLL